MVRPGVRILPMGERALLVEAGTLDDVLALHRGLAASLPRGVVELVPAARTVLVVIDPRTLPPSAARAWIERTAAGAGEADAEAGPLVELDIVYDGPDLAGTAELLGLAVVATVPKSLPTATGFEADPSPAFPSARTGTVCVGRRPEDVSERT